MRPFAQSAASAVPGGSTGVKEKRRRPGKAAAAFYIGGRAPAAFHQFGQRQAHGVGLPVRGHDRLARMDRMQISVEDEVFGLAIQVGAATVPWRPQRVDLTDMRAVSARRTLLTGL